MGLGRPTRVSVSLQSNKQQNQSDFQQNHFFSLLKWIIFWNDLFPDEHLLSQCEANELISTGLQEVLNVFLPVETQTCTHPQTHTHCVSFLKSHQSHCVLPPVLLISIYVRCPQKDLRFPDNECLINAALLSVCVLSQMYYSCQAAAAPQRGTQGYTDGEHIAEW